MKRLLPFLLIPAALWGDAGEVEIRERNSSNRTVVNEIATGAGNRVLVIDDSNAQGAKVEGAVIGSGLSFDGTTLTASAASRATTDLAGGTALAANVDYYDTFAADRTNLAVWGTPTDGQYSTITFDVTGATRSIGFNSTTVYRLGESSSSTGPWNFPVGNHKITLARMDGKWFLIDSAVDTEAANVFLASPDGTTGPMTPRAIVDGDIPASITRDSEAAAAYEPLDADIAKVNEVETITANWVNTANPWADNEVSDTLTASLFVGSGSTTTAVDLATAEVSGILPVSNGGTGVSTSGTTSQIAVGGGTSLPIVWTTATGTGAPVRAVSPALTTNPTAPTQTAGDNDTSIATTAFVQSAARGSQTGVHATPSTTNPLAPTWTSVMHSIWYGATGEIDLPAAAGYTGRGCVIYNTGAFTITIDPNASEVIVRDGTVQTGGVSFTLSSGAGNYVALISDGARWITLGYKGTLAVGS